MVIRLGCGRGPGARRGQGGRPQQRLGLGQEDLPGLGELTAQGGPVQQAGAQLLFEPADLPAQGRLGDAQGAGGAAEVPMVGEDGEVPHQPQVEVRRRRRVRHACMVRRLLLAGS